jgi:hypothetical protein
MVAAVVPVADVEMPAAIEAFIVAPRPRRPDETAGQGVNWARCSRA